MISSFFPFGEICDRFLEGNNHATWENLMQISGQLKKKLKRIGNKNSISTKIKRRVVSQGPCCLLIATPHAKQKEQNIQDKSFVKKKNLSENCPKTFLQLFLFVHPGKIRWNAKSWSFVSNDFFQFSVMFSFNMWIFRDGVIMMILILTYFHQRSTLNQRVNVKPNTTTPDSRHYHQVLTLPMHGPNLGSNLRLGQLGAKNTTTAGLMQLGLKYQKKYKFEAKKSKK